MTALYDGFLSVARLLLNADAEPESSFQQAAFRRAVSSAYYALFHFLISEATRHWSIASQRGALGRVFNHGAMKAACANRIAETNSYLRAGPHLEDATVAIVLRNVAEAFVRMQERRESADYDTEALLTETDVAKALDSVVNAFQEWQTIRETPEAQDFVLSLFVKKR